MFYASPLLTGRGVPSLQHGFRRGIAGKATRTKALLLFLFDFICSGKHEFLKSVVKHLKNLFPLAQSKTPIHI